MNIGKAAKASGISAKMIRYYESVGLIPRAVRSDGNYRDYSEADVHRLIFVKRARELGFGVHVIRNLLGLWSNRKRSNAEVRAVATQHITAMEAQAEKLHQVIRTLRHLVGNCKGGNRPDCPIMEELSGGAEPPVSAARRQGAAVGLGSYGPRR